MSWAGTIYSVGQESPCIPAGEAAWPAARARGKQVFKDAADGWLGDVPEVTKAEARRPSASPHAAAPPACACGGTNAGSAPTTCSWPAAAWPTRSPSSPAHPAPATPRPARPSPLEAVPPHSTSQPCSGCGALVRTSVSVPTPGLTHEKLLENRLRGYSKVTIPQ